MEKRNEDSRKDNSREQEKRREDSRKKDETEQENRTGKEKVGYKIKREEFEKMRVNTEKIWRRREDIDNG